MIGVAEKKDWEQRKNAVPNSYWRAERDSNPRPSA